MVEYASRPFRSCWNSAAAAPQSSVAMPARVTISNHKSVPASAGYKRASRNTPAFTMVAECRYALTGVGAAMAWGNQKWNGNWALLVKAPSSTRHRISGYNSLPRIRSPLASTSVSENDPTTSPINNTPASSARPPMPVTVIAMRAPLRAPVWWPQKPISRKELRLVSSQNTTSNSRLSLVTTPSMAPIKSSR